MKKFSLVLFLTAALFTQVLAKGNDAAPANDAKNQWDLTRIYENWNSWDADFNKLQNLMGEVAQYKGRLHEGPEVLLELLQKQEEMSKTIGMVFRYPYFMRQIDSRDMEVAAKLQKVSAVYAQYATTNSWIQPELLDIPKETMEKWLESSDTFEPYKFGIMDSYRLQEHVLEADKEKLMSYFSTPMSSGQSIYTEISTSDIQFPSITLSTGEEVQLTHGNYSRLLEKCEKQEDRKRVFEEYMNIYKQYENTYASIYKAICEKDNAYAQARGYQSTLHRKLEGNNIPVDVYMSLIKTARDNVKPLQKYFKLRKKVMQLEEMHGYDLSTKMVEFDKEYTFDEAIGLVQEAVKPLGKEYMKKLENAVRGGWIDVYEKPNKTSGAFSANVYGLHPYILLNWNKSLNHVFTLAHELGHSMHSVYSNENQPYATHGYTIFVAEVASTFNEHLLLESMLEKSTIKNERIALLQQAIENIWGTFYIQSLFADFEYQVHKAIEERKPVTARVLNAIMGDLYKQYYGDNIVHDELTDVKWARISHFYEMPYYVYQYATSFSASSNLYQQVTQGSKKEKREALERYIALLKSGGDDYPVNQLKKAGVDMTTTEPFEAVVDQMSKLVDQLEEELNSL